MDLANMGVATLLRRHPYAEEVLDWHGVDVATLEPTITVAGLCLDQRLDVERFVRDLLMVRGQADGSAEDWQAADPAEGAVDEVDEVEDVLDDDGDDVDWIPDDDEAPHAWWEDYADEDLRFQGRRYHP